MNTKELHALYVKSGFFWNPELAEFVRVYGGREIAGRKGYYRNSYYPIRFCYPKYIKQGRSNFKYVLTADFLGEDVAPVGDCDGPHTILLLTESGKLFGFSDYIIGRWGENPH